jgi:hypothetical protein
MRIFLNIMGVVAILGGLFGGFYAFMESGGSNGIRNLRFDELFSPDDGLTGTLGMIGLFMFAGVCFMDAARRKRKGS